MELVHFILIGGRLTPQYRRAIQSAYRTQHAKIWLWHTDETPPSDEDLYGLGNIALMRCKIPSWLEKEHPAHIWDVLAYGIGFEIGGIVLGLDTISLLRADNLLGDHDVVVSTDWPPEDHANFPDCYNNNFIAKQGSHGAKTLYETAKRLVTSGIGSANWGYTGPRMLTNLVQDNPGKIGAAAYPALCGWSPGYIWRFYLGQERPHPNTRVIHLCAQAYKHLYEGNYDAWAKQYPDYAGPVEHRTTQ